MSIKDLQSIHTKQYENQKTRNARELSKINDAHNNLKADIGRVQEAEIVEINRNHQHKIDTAHKRKENLISQMKDQLETTQKMTEKEIRELKKNNEATKLEEQRKLSTERALLNDQHKLSIEEMHEKFKYKTKELNSTAQNNLEDLKFHREQEIYENNNYYQEKLSRQNENLNQEIVQKKNSYEKILNDQEVEFKQARLDKNRRQQIDLEKLTNEQLHHLEKRDQHMRQGLKQQDVMFDQKFAQTLEKSNAEITGLEQRKNKSIEALKNQLVTELKTTTEKSQDEFYTTVNLAPKLKKFDKHVEVTVPVAEHAKNDLFVTINNKDVILNFNRKYSETNSTDGVSHKFNKVESMVSRVHTGEHLNPRSVKSRFEDGQMIYTIQKA